MVHLVLKAHLIVCTAVENGRCSRPGPLFYLLKRGGWDAVDIPACLLYTDWSGSPVILVALRVDSGVLKILIN